ncbi:MAG: ATP-dependent DNA helicase RecG [Endomicrobiales bacterium]|nr:ATP-dependent DNA helicase RecG [Endomicrobiales bacterium]
MKFILDEKVQYLKGVGPSRAKILARMGILTVRDLIEHYPRDYSDRRNVTKIADALSGRKATICGAVKISSVVPLNMKLSVFKAAVEDPSGIMWVEFFRKANPYHKHDIFSSLKATFEKGNRVFIFGKVEEEFGLKKIVPDDYELVVKEGEEKAFRKVVPVYPLTEGLSQKWMREAVFGALKNAEKDLNDILAERTLKKYGLTGYKEALNGIHFPDDMECVQKSRERLAFDEFLVLHAALAVSKKGTENIRKRQEYGVKKDILTPFREKLKFEFTRAQKKAINEIFRDLQSKKPMNRLLMGDVGSGKTVVALCAMLLAAENGYQSAMLAPTEILAEQHALTINRMLDGLPVRTALLTSGEPKAKKQREKLLNEIGDGKVDFVVGTHALLEKSVVFGDLSLIVIDEQHRFGVLQRASLTQKAGTPDVLLTTATPIPRTLSMTLYGDMEASVIDELPPNRQAVETLHLDETSAYEFAKKQMKSGRQVFIVYPLVEESDKRELKSAVAEARALSKSEFSGYRVGLLHGQMSTKEKDGIMTEFRDARIDVLITTTVIEVGIDIPNATLMIIEHADRFGLATLHQLRGRVGRGKEKSWCVLLGEPKTEEAKKRIEIMTATNSGFDIAEEDLVLRGPGEFLGTAQHGIPVFKAGNIVKDGRLIEAAKGLAAEMIAGDPDLKSPENEGLKKAVLKTHGPRIRLANIG